MNAVNEENGNKAPAAGNSRLPGLCCAVRARPAAGGSRRSTRQLRQLQQLQQLGKSLAAARSFREHTLRCPPAAYCAALPRAYTALPSRGILRCPPAAYRATLPRHTALPSRGIPCYSPAAYLTAASAILSKGRSRHSRVRVCSHIEPGVEIPCRRLFHGEPGRLFNLYTG